MSKRIAPIILTISLLAFGSYSYQAGSEPPRSFTSGQLSWHGSDADVNDQPLNDTQLTALSSWFNAETDCSHFSMNVPEEAPLEIHLKLRDASGENWRVDVFQRKDGDTAAYIYEGQRIAPAHCPLDSDRFTALQKALHS